METNISIKICINETVAINVVLLYSRIFSKMIFFSIRSVFRGIIDKRKKGEKDLEVKYHSLIRHD